MNLELSLGRARVSTQGGRGRALGGWAGRREAAQAREPGTSPGKRQEEAPSLVTLPAEGP